MALVNCPECGKEISDKVKTCPHCGYPMLDEPQQVEVSGVTLIKNDTPERKRKRKTIVIATILILIVGTASGIFINQKSKTNNENAYQENLYLTTNQMLSNAATMETMTNTVKETWGDAIDTDRDFNDELDNLYDSDSFKNNLAELSNFSTTLESDMKNLQDPPEKYDDAYNKVLELYQIYQGLYSQTKSPTGSLITYSSDVNEKLDSFLSTYKQIGVLLPDLETKAKDFSQDTSAN